MSKPDPRTTPFEHADMLDGRDLQARLRHLLNDKEDDLLTDTERGDRTLLLKVSAALDKPLENYVFVNYEHMAAYAESVAEHKHGKDMLNRWPFDCIDWDAAADSLACDWGLQEVEIGAGAYYAIS